MTALAEALVVAQRRALSALSKSYVHLGDVEQPPGRDAFRAAMDKIGLTDKVEQDQLIACLEVVRAMGGETPSEPTANGKPTDEPATDAQWTLVRKLAGEKKQPVPDGPLTKAQAHEIIDTLKAGTYDAGKWAVPFL